MSVPDGLLHLLVAIVGPPPVGLDAEALARGVGGVEVPQDAVEPAQVDLLPVSGRAWRQSK